MDLPLTFQSDRWVQYPHATMTSTWQSLDGDTMALYHSATSPDLPVPLNDLDALRDSLRIQLAGVGGGIIELDVVALDSIPTMRLIAKLPQEVAGMAYVGSYTIPRRDFSYTLKIQCFEQGMTGLRESLVLDQVLAANLVSIDAQGHLVGWSSGPYAPAFQEGAVRNLADDARYDALIPDHPLSRLRVYMRELDQTMRFATMIKQTAPFLGPPAQRRRWWWWKR